MGCFSGSKQLREDRTDLITSNPKHCWCEKQRPKGLGAEAQKCGHFILLERQLGHCYEACGETGILKLSGWMKRMAMVSAAMNPGGGDLLSLRLV